MQFIKINYNDTSKSWLLINIYKEFSVKIKMNVKCSTVVTSIQSTPHGANMVDTARGANLIDS